MSYKNCVISRFELLLKKNLEINWSQAVAKDLCLLHFSGFPKTSLTDIFDDGFFVLQLYFIIVVPPS